MWTDAMRQEYKNSSIEFSVICPGFIQDSGMFHDSGQNPPKLLGSSLAQDVANAVLDCIKKQKAEVIVNPGPMKPLLALAQIYPLLADWIVNFLGVPQMSKKRI